MGVDERGERRSRIALKLCTAHPLRAVNRWAGGGSDAEHRAEFGRVVRESLFGIALQRLREREDLLVMVFWKEGLNRCDQLVEVALDAGERGLDGGLLGGEGRYLVVRCRERGLRLAELNAGLRCFLVCIRDLLACPVR